MDNKGSTRNVISSYRRRRTQSNTVFVYGAAGLLALAGLVLLVVWLAGPSRPLSALFATDTPTPTTTFTPSVTPPPSETPTITSTPTTPSTATPSSPFTYTVQEGDSLAAIAERYALGDNGILLILLLNPYDPTSGNGIDPTTQIVFVGQQIIIPNPGMDLPTATPIPANLPRGTKVNYVVQPGDTLAGIASKFNSTIETIEKENQLTDANAIYVGQLLVVPVNMVTPTATRPPTSTPSTPGSPIPSATP